MSLSPQQIDQFRARGYTTDPTFLTPREVGAIRADLDRLRDAGKFGNVATAGDGKTASAAAANLQICPLNPHSTLFRAFAFHRKALEVASQLVGDPVLLQLDQVFLKPARHGSGTNWHQDNAYFQLTDPMQGTAMWIAVHDATIANGTIRVIPDVWSESLKHDRDPESNHHIRCWPDESKQVHLELPAGGAAFFCYGTPHATGANNTDADRAGVAYHFLRAGAAANESKPPRTRLTGPEATGGEREYGVNVAAAWDREVAAALGEA